MVVHTAKLLLLPAVLVRDREVGIERMKQNIRRSFTLPFELEKLQKQRAAIYTEAVDRAGAITV